MEDMTRLVNVLLWGTLVNSFGLLILVGVVVGG